MPDCPRLPTHQPLAQAAAERRLGTKSPRFQAPRRAGGQARNLHPQQALLLAKPANRPFYWPNREKKPKTHALPSGGFSGTRAGSATGRRPLDPSRGLRGGAEPWEKGRRREGTLPFLEGRTSRKGTQGSCAYGKVRREGASVLAEALREGRCGLRSPCPSTLRCCHRFLSPRSQRWGPRKPQGQMGKWGDPWPLPGGCVLVCKGVCMGGPRNPVQSLPHGAGQ